LKHEKQLLCGIYHRTWMSMLQAVTWTDIGYGSNVIGYYRLAAS